MVHKRFVGRAAAVCMVLAAGAGILTMAVHTARAGVAHNFGGFPGLGFGSSFINVGGVAIDAEGMLADVDREVRDQVRKQRDKLKANVPKELQGDKKGPELRKFSLRQLQEAMMKIRVEDRPGRLLTESMRYMAGIQRIQYIFVYPDDNDIVIAGPAEAWKFDDAGNIVGVTTGRPVVLLEDFLVAMRTALKPGAPIISCSIDPTAEGTRKMREYTSQLKRIRNPNQVKAQIEELLGPQTVDIRGVDRSSRFAWIITAADYRMKRLAMGFEKAPVRGLPSFVDMLGSRRSMNAMPRWWLEDNYEALLTDGEGLAWELRGPGVKVMSEDELVAKDGTRKGTGKVDPIAKKWADAMTANYDDLSVKQPIFGHLRNCMDLAVVSALIVSENLHGKAGLDISVFSDGETIPVRSMNEPSRIPSQATVTKKRSAWVITASGGVQINMWRAARRHEKSDTINKIRDDAIAPAGADWFWK